jgi:hypothetical protein
VAVGLYLATFQLGFSVVSYLVIPSAVKHIFCRSYFGSCRLGRGNKEGKYFVSYYSTIPAQ